MEKTKLAVIFGGESAENEFSVDSCAKEKPVSVKINISAKSFVFIFSYLTKGIEFCPQCHSYKQ